MRVPVGNIHVYFDVDGCRLVPDGPRMVERPTLVLLHGGPGADHSTFKPVFARATEFAQVVYLDSRGSGRSDRGDPERWSWEQWADDVIDFCDAVDIADPVLVGTSAGGWVALTAAIRHPDRVGRLVLDSVMPGPPEERLEIFERLGGVEARDIARRYMSGEAPETVRDAWERTCLPLYSRRPGGDPDGQDRMRRIAWNYDVLERFRQHLVDDFDGWTRLDEVTCPTLVLAGEHDPVATASSAKRLTAGLTHADAARLHVLPDSGHGVFRESPDRAFELLREFVGER
jgi:pimeloyl-ACP methyl ester carboxylesterase